MKLPRLTTLILCVAFLAAAAKAGAVPAYPGPSRITQPDGTPLTIRVNGDEFFHYTTTQDGYNIVQGADGFYYYAVLQRDGSMSATAVKAKDPGYRTAEDRAVLGSVTRGVPQAVAAMRRETARSRSLLNKTDPETVNPSLRRALTSSERFQSLVILVNFSDRSYTTPNPQQAFTSLLNQDGYSVNGAEGSAWNYYQDNSNGRFDPQFVVVGPYTLPHNMDYYGANTGYSNDANPWQMAVDACNAAYNAGVDFSRFAENGQARDIFIYYAGYNEAEGGPANSVWPHRSYINHTVGGIRVSGYACSSELKGSSGSTMAAIGTFCHEFGHVMGWPDFYDTDYETNGQATALDVFSLMASGSYNNDSRTPPALNINERSMVGWATPVEITKKGDYTLGAVEDDNGYIIQTSNPNEYYLFENRQAGKYPWDRFFTSSVGSGMVVYHVDKSNNSIGGYTAAMLWQINQLNAYAAHECMKIVKASEGNRNRWFFPGAANTTQFTADGSPAFVGWNGEPVGLEVKDIAVSNKVVSFRMTNSGNAIVRGYVYNMRNEPLKNAAVKFTPLSPSEAPGIQGLSLAGRPLAAGYQTTTDGSGRFSIPEVEPGNYRLSVTREGYDEYIENMELKSTVYDLRVVMKTPDESRSRMYSYYKTYVNSAGMPDSSPFTVGAQWDYADLRELPGDRYKLIGEEFYVTAACSATAVVYINDRQVCSEPVQPSAGGWTYVDLSRHEITVEPGQNVKVGVTLSGYSNYPIAIDEQAEDKGKLQLSGNTWIPVQFTWAIRGYFTGNGAATGITLDKTAAETFNGNEIKLIPSLLPEGAGGTVEWTTDNEDAAVPMEDSPGYIRAMRPGTANITATVKETGASASCRVTVKDEISGQVQITVSSPDDISLRWTPAVERDVWIVSWNEQGTSSAWVMRETEEPALHFGGLKADTKYDLRIGGKRGDDGFWGFRSMTFSTADVQYVEEIGLPDEIVTVPGYSVTVEPEIGPISATSRELVWSTADPEIAAVDENGTVTGIKNGRTVLTVKAKFGGAEATAAVNVENEPAGYLTEAYQNDAVVSWKAVVHKGSWKVSYKKAAGGESLEAVVDTTMIYLPLLTPGTKYEVTVQSIEGTEPTGVPTKTGFTTESVTSPYASMKGMKGTYASGEEVSLTLIDIEEPIQDISWTADGRKIEPPAAVFPAGEHTLKAVVTLKGGGKQVFMKKITVN